MRKVLNFIGLWLKFDNSVLISFDVNEYNATEEKKVTAHKELLQTLERKEDERLSIIDAKTSQIITYTGIIFSALSLFIPILLDKISNHSLVVKITFISILILAFLFYVLTIHNAIRNYNVSNFPYSRADPKNVIKYQEKNVTEFRAIEVRDLIYSYKQNSKSNDRKADNLIYAYRTFRIANILTALMGVLICSSLLFTNSKERETNVGAPVQIQNIENNIRDTIIRKQIDTIK
jgi:hypothetical protein